MARWIKIFNKFLQWEWFEKAEMVQLFLYILLSANYKEMEWRGISVKRGQLLTTRDKIGKDLRLTDRQIRTCLSRLRETGEIAIKTTNKYTLVTVCKYDDYQAENSTQRPANDQQNDQRPANDQQNDQQTTSKTTSQKSSITPSKADDCEIENNSQRPANDQQNDQQTVVKPTTIIEDIEDKNNNINSNQRLESGRSPLPSASDEAQASNQANPKTENLPAMGIKKLWNETCVGYPKLFTISENRRNKMRLRIAEMGGAEKALPLLKVIFGKMQESRFLRGDNRRGWKASFDWLFENDKNWVKVYEGNYDNKPEQQFQSKYNNEQKIQSNATSNKQESNDRRRGTEVVATSAEDYDTVF